MIDEYPGTGCPNCEGIGFYTDAPYLMNLNKPPSKPINRFPCPWCKGEKFDQEKWVEYQPHQQRPKEFCDIRLNTGLEIRCCYPNSDIFNPWMEYNKAITIRIPNRITDDMVTHVRITKCSPWDSEDPMMKTAEDEERIAKAAAKQKRKQEARELRRCAS